MSIIFFALLTGCGGTFSDILPTVKFNRLDVTGLSFEEIGIDFVFDVDNPNPIGIPIQRFDYALAFEGIEFLSGNQPDGLRIAADDSSSVALPLALDFDGIFETAEAVRGLDYIGFGLEGGFGFDTDIGPVDVAFDEEGDFPALRTPRIDLSGLNVLQATGDEVEFGLDIDVDNDQGSNLDFADLGFQMKFAGAQVGQGDMEEVGTVPGATTKTFRIPFGVDYVDAIGALAAASTGEPLDVEMDAEVDVDTPFGLVPLLIDESGDITVSEE